VFRVVRKPLISCSKNQKRPGDDLEIIAFLFRGLSSLQF
jgi:hypothetical protein